MSDDSRIDDFRDAVTAIDRGDVISLRALLERHPHLASDRLEDPPDWLRAQVGNAVDGFFSRPYLLWFVAEDPVRNGSLPPNIVAVIDTIVSVARGHDCRSLQETLDSTLQLVSWSGVAARCALQLPMIDALIDAGAKPDGLPNSALVNGHIAAAEHLLSRGAALTLPAAVCLRRWDDAERLVGETRREVHQFSLVLAALNGNADAVRWLLNRGAAPSAPSPELYSHGTPLHHAVCSGSLETVEVLVEAGADLDRPDSAWGGTPLGWAEHYVEGADPSSRARYVAIAEFLRQRAR